LKLLSSTSTRRASPDTVMSAGEQKDLMGDSYYYYAAAGAALPEKLPREHCVHAGEYLCECGRGSPTHGLPWKGQSGRQWCSECPYMPSVAVNMTKYLRQAAALVDDVQPRQHTVYRQDAVLQEAAVMVPDGVYAARLRDIYSYCPVVAVANKTTTRLLTTNPTKRRQRERQTLEYGEIPVSTRPHHRRPFPQQDCCWSEDDDDESSRCQQQESPDIPVHMEAVATRTVLSPTTRVHTPVPGVYCKQVRRSRKTLCECGAKVPSYGLLPCKSARWCLNCPTKPDTAVNVRARKCACGEHAPSFGFPGGKPRDAKWCAKCPTRPEGSVDVKSKRCLCGKAQASLGIAGMGASSATWCKQCPDKPAHAVNVKARRCECGKVQAYLGLLEDSSASLARWCISCPTRPEGTVNVKIPKYRKR
jgi:hypothetical protein